MCTIVGILTFGRTDTIFGFRDRPHLSSPTSPPIYVRTGNSLMKFDWKITCKGKYIDSGSIQAETQKQALGEVLLAQVGKREDDKCYSVKVGDSMTTSFGDEFERSAGATSWGPDEPELEDGYLFKPKLEDVGLTEDQKADLIDKFLDGDDAKNAKALPWDNADATPIKDIQDAVAGIAGEFIADKVFPKVARGASDVLSAAFGNKTPQVADMIRGYGHRPEDVIEVFDSPQFRSKAIHGRLYDRDRKEMWWKLEISEVQLHHM